MPTFPALDPEPPPRPVARTAALVAGLCVVVLVVVVAVWRWPQPQANGPAATRSRSTLDLPGRLLVLDLATSELGHSRPDGTGFTPIQGTDVAGSFGAVSPDGDWLVPGDGLLVRLVGDGAVVTDPVPAQLRVGYSSYAPSQRPFADHAQRLVLLTQGGGRADVATVTMGGEQPHRLGDHATDAVGDPTRDGALVLVAGSRLVQLGGYGRLETSALELRTPGHARQVATVRRLAREAELPPRAPYAAQAGFSADGALLAVTLDQLSTSGGTGHALLVLDRRGKVLQHRDSIASFGFRWSPTDHRLLLWGDGKVSVLDAGTGTVTPLLADRDVDACLWSPDAARRLVLDPDTGDREEVRLPSTDRVALAWLGKRR